MVLLLLSLPIIVLLLVNNIVLVEVLASVTLPNHALHVADPV